MSNSAIAFLIALTLAACGMLGEAPEHVVLDGSIETLRARFNADSGKVRAILLGSPT
ncbi:MAG: hypothetical protein ACREK2_08740 [Gemmatimonadota bacterium]